MTSGTRGDARAAIVLLAAAALFVLGPRLLDRAVTPIPGVAARASGQFLEGGLIPMDRGVAPDGERQDGFPRHERAPGGGRFWSSWNGSNAGRGELVLGPFPAPRVLAIDVCGYAHVGGSGLYVENAATLERRDVAADNIGAGWCAVRLVLPASWRGKPVTIHAVDGAEGFYGWMAVGEPGSAPIFAAWWDSLWRKLHGFAGAGLILFVLQAAAMRLLRGRPELPEAILPLASLALVALAGYGVFWVFLASSAAGKAVVWGLLCASACVVIRGRGAAEARVRPDARIPLLLMAAVGGLYLGILLLYGSDRSLSDIASRRFIDHLAVDNALPQMFADRLIHGEDPRHLAYGWWSSGDRPPLQAGCDLLIAYPLAAAGVNFDTAAQSAGMWMQLLWVCAAWAFLRMMGSSAARSAWIIALLAPTGFLLLNTVYVWPKLLSGALILGAFSLWLSLRDRERPEPRALAAVAALGTLGFLSNAGAMFSILAWLPFGAARLARQRLASWVAAAAVFAMLVVPWMAYQLYYDPPANLLLKWHLGGANLPDGRGTWETIRSAYLSHDVVTLLHYRMANVATMFRGPWNDRIGFPIGDLVARRDGEYYGIFFALGFWNLGFIALFALPFLVRRGRIERETSVRLRMAAGWCVVTLLVWLALMFLPQSTVIHQGPYACILLLLLSAALALWLAHPAAFFLVAAAGLAGFAEVWILPNPGRFSSFNQGAAVLAALAAVSLVTIAATASEGAEAIRSEGQVASAKTGSVGSAHGAAGPLWAGLVAQGRELCGLLRLMRRLR